MNQWSETQNVQGAVGNTAKAESAGGRGKCHGRSDRRAEIHQVAVQERAQQSCVDRMWRGWEHVCLSVHVCASRGGSE